MDLLLDLQREADEDSDSSWEHKARFGSDRDKIVASIRFGGVNKRGEELRSNKFCFTKCSYWATLGNVAKWSGQDQHFLLQHLASKLSGYEGGLVRYRLVAFFETGSPMVSGIGVTDHDIPVVGGGKFLFARYKETGQRPIHKNFSPKEMVRAWKDANEGYTQYLVALPGSTPDDSDVSVLTREDMPIMPSTQVLARDKGFRYAQIQEAFFRGMEGDSDMECDEDDLASPVI